MPPRERGRRQPHGPSGRDADELLPWAVIYYLAPDETVPALEFLDGCPGTIDAQFTAVLERSCRGASSAVLRWGQVGGYARLDGRLVRDTPDRAPA